MKVWIADATLAALKCKLREAQEEGNENMAAFTRGCLTIMQQMPTIDVTDGIECKKCFFYDKDKHRCTHKNGLMGRLRPGMYCSYGSYHHDEDAEDYEDDDFSEFEEESDES